MSHVAGVLPVLRLEASGFQTGDFYAERWTSLGTPAAKRQCERHCTTRRCRKYVDMCEKWREVRSEPEEDYTLRKPGSCVAQMYR